jgi:hypothetical protein
MATASITPKIVQVPDIGNIQFPGDMPDDQIAAAIRKNFPKAGQSARPAATIIPGPKSGVSMNAPVSSLLLGAAGGVGLPETKHPISDLAASIVSPPNVLEASGAKAPPVPELQPGDIEAEQKALAGRGFFQKLLGLPGELDPQVAARLDARRKAQLINAYQNYVPGTPLVSPAFAASAEQAGKASQAFQEGRPYEGTVRAAGAAVPIIGPAAVEAGSEIGEGIQEKDIDKILHGVGAGAGMVGGLALGTKRGQAATEKVISKTVRPTIQTITGVPIAATSKVLGGGPEAMQKRPIKQQPAAGSASNLEVAQYAKEHGIDLLPGQATQARGLKTLQAVGERTVVSPGILPEVLDQQKANFGNLVDDFKGRVGTEAIPDTEAAGTSLKSQAQHGLDTLKGSAQADYQGFQQAVGDIPVDLSDLKTKYAAKLADQAEALRNVPAEYSGPVKNVLSKLAGIEAGPPADPRALADFRTAVDTYGLNPEAQATLRERMGLPAETGSAQVKMSTAQQLRSAYLDIARDYSGNIPKSVQRLAGEAAKDIDGAMAASADKAGATQQWRQANAKWKQLQETYNNPEHPLYRILQEPDATKVPSRLLGKGSYGGSPNVVRQLKQAGIDLSPLKREVTQQIADRNFSLTNGGRGLAGYTTPFLQELFSPAEFDELTKIGRIGRAINFELNPSGTSNVMEGHRQIRGIIHRTGEALVGPIASRLTTSKALARAAMGDITPSRSIPGIPGGPPQSPPPEIPPSGGNGGSGGTPTPSASPPNAQLVTTGQIAQYRANAIKSFGGPRGATAAYTDEGIRSAAGIPQAVSLRDLESVGALKHNPDGTWQFTPEPKSPPLAQPEQIIKEKYGSKYSLPRKISEKDWQAGKGRFWLFTDGSASEVPTGHLESAARAMGSTESAEALNLKLGDSGKLVDDFIRQTGAIRTGIDPWGETFISALDRPNAAQLTKLAQTTKTLHWDLHDGKRVVNGRGTFRNLSKAVDDFYGTGPTVNQPSVSGGSTPAVPTERSVVDILRGPEPLIKRPTEGTYTGPERRAVGRNLTSRIGEFRKEFLSETDPAKRAELQRAIDRESAVEAGRPSTPEPHVGLPPLEEAVQHAKTAPPITEYQRGLNSTPEGMIRSAGLVSKGEVSPGTGVYQFEDPSAPGKTASMTLADMQKDGVAGIKAKMAEKLAEMKNVRSVSDILANHPQEKIDLNAPKSKRKIPPTVTATADVSGQTVPEKAPTFFSKAEQVVQEKIPNTVSADQVMPTLRNAGVKEEQLKWLGLDDYLKGKQKISKADLLNYIKQNDVQVKEVIRGKRIDQEKVAAAEANLRDVEARIAQASTTNVKPGDRVATYGSVGSAGRYTIYGGKIYEATVRKSDGRLIWKKAGEFGPTRTTRSDKFINELKSVAKYPWLESATQGAEVNNPGIAPELARELSDARHTLSKAKEGTGKPTKFSKYQLPGGENYRELLLTLPAKLDAYDQFMDQLRAKYGDHFQGKMTAAELQRADDLWAPEAERKDTSFRSSHFDEPNVLAHVRFNDRISPDGKKTLFIEEVQSDWHQKGRKQGYTSDLIKPEQLSVNKTGPTEFLVTGPDGLGVAIDRASVTNEVQAKQFAADHFNRNLAPNRVPDAPFKTTWHELAMKRMLRYAAENGYDRVAWTTGEQQAARYDLSKHVDSIKWQKNPDGTFNISPIKNGEGVGDASMQGVAPQKLSDVVGKEVAEKIVNGQGQTWSDKKGTAQGELSNLDLKVGGQGMKGFYDKILPDFLNKYGKKWGAKVEKTTLPMGAEDGQWKLNFTDDQGRQVTHGFNTRQDAQEWMNRIKTQSPEFINNPSITEDKKGTPIHSIDVTPAMRKDVLFKGQPISRVQPPRSTISMMTGANA